VTSTTLGEGRVSTMVVMDYENIIVGGIF